MFERIDQIARQGYLYAIGEEYECTIESDMDLMAFNAGITNANGKHNLSVQKLQHVSCRYIQGPCRTSDKELSLR
nr:hypothetical protein [Vibrio sp. 04Ya108]